MGRATSSYSRNRSGRWAILICLALSAVVLGGTSDGAAQVPGSGSERQTDSPLQPGDGIRLTIWQEPGMSGEFTVDNLGVVVLPRLGPINVVGEPTDRLRARLTEAYGEFLSHSSIDVTLLRRVQVLGAVRSPGLYKIDSTMNLSDVLALAGGVTPQGRNRIRLIRDGTTVADDLSPFTPVGSSPLRSGDQIVVPEKSWIVRNPGLVIGGISTVVSITLALLR